MNHDETVAVGPIRLFVSKLKHAVPTSRPQGRRVDRSSAAKNALISSGKRPTSNYRGVNLHARSARWEAHIWDGQQVHLGCFSTEVHAAIAYDLAAMHLKGSKAHLNFDGGCYGEHQPVLEQMEWQDLLTSLRGAVGRKPTKPQPSASAAGSAGAPPMLGPRLTGMKRSARPTTTTTTRSFGSRGAPLPPACHLKQEPAASAPELPQRPTHLPGASAAGVPARLRAAASAPHPQPWLSPSEAGASSSCSSSPNIFMPHHLAPNAHPEAAQGPRAESSQLHPSGHSTWYHASGRPPPPRHFPEPQSQYEGDSGCCCRCYYCTPPPATGEPCGACPPPAHHYLPPAAACPCQCPRLPPHPHPQGHHHAPGLQGPHAHAPPTPNGTHTPLCPYHLPPPPGHPAAPAGPHQVQPAPSAYPFPSHSPHHPPTNPTAFHPQAASEPGYAAIMHLQSPPARYAPQAGHDHHRAAPSPTPHSQEPHPYYPLSARGRTPPPPPVHATGPAPVAEALQSWPPSDDCYSHHAQPPYPPHPATTPSAVSNPAHPSALPGPTHWRPSAPYADATACDPQQALTSGHPHAPPHLASHPNHPPHPPAPQHHRLAPPSHEPHHVVTHPPSPSPSAWLNNSHHLYQHTSATTTTTRDSRMCSSPPLSSHGHATAACQSACSCCPGILPLDPSPTIFSAAHALACRPTAPNPAHPASAMPPHPQPAPPPAIHELFTPTQPPHTRHPATDPLDPAFNSTPGQATATPCDDTLLLAASFTCPHPPSNPEIWSLAHGSSGSSGGWGCVLGGTGSFQEQDLDLLLQEYLQPPSRGGTPQAVLPRPLMDCSQQRSPSSTDAGHSAFSNVPAWQ